MDRDQGMVPHNPVTLSGGSDAALSLSTQQLTLSDVLTPTEHTAIGDSSPHHAAITLATSADVLLGLSTQQLTLDTQSANVVLAGPVSGAAAAPTFRAMVAADFGTTLSPTFASVLLTNLSDGYVPYRVTVTGLLGNSPIYTDGTNVGIGTTTLGYKLGIKGGDINFIGNQYLRFNDSASFGYDGTQYVFYMVPRLLFLGAQGAERVRIDGTSGNVLIGTTSFGTSAVSNLSLGSGIPPTTAPVNMAQMWVADQVAGNACFQMMTENGAILKLYRVVDATVDDVIEAEFTTLYPLASGILNGLRTALQAQGLMAAA